MRNFNDIYEKIYEKSFKIIEGRREIVKKRILTFSVLIIIIGIILSICLKTIVFTILGIFISLIYRNNNKDKSYYNAAYKKLIIKTLIEEYNPNLMYIHNKGVDPLLYLMGEFKKFDKYSSEDYIGGLLSNGKKLQMSDITTMVKNEDSNGRTTYSVNFQGLFAKIDLDKEISSTIKIRKNSLLNINSYNRLEMDSGEFERTFNVYTNKKIYAMQILTLDIMQHIIDFVNTVKIIPEFTIKENSIYIRFISKNVNENYFEANPLKSALDHGTLKKYFSILDFIEKITTEISKNIEEAGI